jgi:hypothetical protein
VWAVSSGNSFEDADMRRLLVAALAVSALVGGAARAASVTDPTGDFLASFAGAHDPDLDVTAFSVNFDPVAMSFDLGASLAGPIDPAEAGLYVIGVDTGAGAIRPFAGIGEPNVIFDQAIVVQKTGATTLGANSLTATISGDSFSLVVPLAMLPSTGRTPQQFGFNLWPRNGLGNNNQISDFAPNNQLLSGVPEPAAWAMMVAGFGVLGGWLRLRRRQGVAVLPVQP